MHSLSAHEIIGVWELCERQTPVNRALAVLGAALPGVPGDDIASLSIGQRDLRLLMLRERLLGPSMESLAECPSCHERLEFTINAADIRACELIDEQSDFEMEIENYLVRFRLIDSHDLIRAASCRSVEDARMLLVERCVIEAWRSDEIITARELPEHVVEELAVKVAECDPQAEVMLNLACPACGHSWQVLFDIVTFLWDELHATAVRLLHEVDILAAAYGWSEDEILTMSATKRKIYLEMRS